MKKLWKKWFGVNQDSKEDVIPVETPVVMEEAVSKNRINSLLDDLEACLFARYDFRFNLLTGQTEYAVKGSASYQLADQCALNTFCLDARRSGINCWDKDVSRLLLSQ